MNLEETRDNVIKLIENVTNECCHPFINKQDFEVKVQPFGRIKDDNLPKGKMAVYIFFYGDKCLKVGQVGPKSGPRFHTQHYNPDSSRSNLAKSILNDEEMMTLVDKSDIGKWIKDNTNKVDVLISSTESKTKNKVILNLIEGLLQFKFGPRYED